MGVLLMSSVLRVKSRLKNYDVHVVSDCAKAIGSQKDSGAFLVIDRDLPGRRNIIRLFPQDHVILFKADENSKTLDGCTRLIHQFVRKNIRRNHVIYAVGGGVVEDTVAFVSMVIFRGLDWVFCPTTLLAQADSCIGSKSSINFGAMKNLLGSFYPPSRIFIDVKFLKTLPPQEVKSGIGEILHFYLVAGKISLAKAMMAKHEQFLQDPIKLKPYILASLRIKKAVIERDELDKGERNLFNYGHTFGHAIETVTNYRISHGQAVSRGMDIANYISWQRGYMTQQTFVSLHQILKPNLPDFCLQGKQWPLYVKALSKDKKNLGKTLGCILTRGAGRMFKTQLPFDAQLKKEIISYFEAY
jgi:3-dehydroquinate synthase